ncbi:MAG: phosphotransferase family protein [Deltaproteobacteria bacterium]|nr:phosphotransferase family protein [Deltaproteobacteria bacterium]
MNDSLDRPEAVRENARLDLDKLAGWLARHDLPGAIEVLQFPRGYSNLTYLLRVTPEGGTPREIVLRRPPAGVKIASAHDMGREHRILSGLRKVWDKVPETIGYEPDESVIGAPFYVMERSHGVIFRAKQPKGIELASLDGRALSTTLIDTLAEIHGVDVAAAGLSDLGKPAGYNARQVKGWTERYEKARTDDVPDVDAIATWLAAHTPTESGVALIHNDFKYDNVIYAPDLSRIVAVLDWEMSTLGDPLMDLGTALSYWVEATDPPLFTAMRFGPTDAPNSLRRMELVERWSEQTGRPATNLVFYFAFALFKLAVVAQQLYQRYARGLTQEPRYAFMIEGVKGLTRTAVRAVENDRIDVLST